MGVGKSTIGKILAAKFGWKYFDNDLQMTERFGYTQAELSSMNVDKLHELESRYLNEILAEPAPFITGAAASVVDEESNLKILKANTSIYLRIPLDLVIARAGSTGVGRQALNADAQKVLTDRYKRRDPLYRASSKFTLDLGTDPNSDALSITEFLQAQIQS